MAADDDDLVEKLELAHRVQQRRVDELAKKLEQVQEILAIRDPAFYLAPWRFDRMIKKEAREAWEFLIRWVDERLIPEYDLAEPYTAEQRRKDKAEGKLLSGTRLRACWFAHPDLAQMAAALYWSNEKAYQRGASHAAAMNHENVQIDAFFARVKQRQASCGGPEGCRWLNGVKPQDVTWPDRVAFVKADVDGRPDKRD